jgi:AcrR family transcriptional regulator
VEGKGWAVREDHEREDTERRRQLVEAARAVFERRGYGLTTIADITEEAGTSRATFYVYFASKKEVFLVLAEYVRADFLAAQDTSGLDQDDLWSVLDVTTGRFLDATVANLALITLLDHEAIGDPDVKRIWGGIRERTIERAAGYLQNAAARGLAQPHVAPMTIARMAFGTVEAFAPPVADGRIRRDVAVAEIAQLFRPLVGGAGPGS